MHMKCNHHHGRMRDDSFYPTTLQQLCVGVGMDVGVGHLDRKEEGTVNCAHILERTFLLTHLFFYLFLCTGKVSACFLLSLKITVSTICS